MGVLATTPPKNENRLTIHLVIKSHKNALETCVEGVVGMTDDKWIPGSTARST